jgi:Ankyrin repeat.
LIFSSIALIILGTFYKNTNAATYKAPTPAQQKELNSYLNPFAESEPASAKRTAEPRRAAKPTTSEPASSKKTAEPTIEAQAIKLIKELKDIDPNYKLPAAQDPSESDLVQLATFHGYAGLLQALIDKEANLNKQNKNFWTPLHIAAELDADQFPNKLEIIKMLVENGASLGSKSKDIPRPIDLVRPNCKLNIEVYEYLMEKMCPAATNHLTPRLQMTRVSADKTSKTNKNAAKK